MGHLGFIAEAQLGRQRERAGNYLYGAFGRDFVCADGDRVMIVGLTQNQWRALCDAMHLGEAMSHLSAELGLNLDEEGGALSRAPAHCRPDRAVDRCTPLHRHPERVRQARRVLGSLPDRQPPGASRSRLLASQSDVQRTRAAGSRPVSDAAHSAGFFSACSRACGACADAWTAHRGSAARCVGAERGGIRTIAGQGHRGWFGASLNVRLPGELANQRHLAEVPPFIRSSKPP